MQATKSTVAPMCDGRETNEIKRICFVCTGNTCRSPMAAAVANAMAQKELSLLPASVRDLAMPGFQAFSAGLYAHDGDPIAHQAILALEEANVQPANGLDYHTHTARNLTEKDAAGFDLLIGLTREHAMGLMIRFPHLAQRITFFPVDISDPYGGSLRVYRDCLTEIRSGIASLLFSENCHE